ncbi:HAD-IIA family hydrolase [Halomarina oriensis]|uniref:HAD-IIA family hydrolase n=1 Tax=Halomarina oriensis TaxID=671145 RepID=A0A6B0GRC5_9EURY|nr:HAD-IIA family hydrolase [Halomarina oriensis]MWG36159.1 HAD-IIA family hydrolase [Halomarina oriensis]
MDVRGAVVDLDGTVYRGDTLVEGARAGIDALRDHGVDPLFVTNNPTRSPAAYARRLGEMGLDVSADRVLSAGSVTAQFLAERHPNDETFVVGSDGLREQLRAVGVSLTDDPHAATVLVTSHTYGFDYEALTEGYWALASAETFVGTDPDLTYPGGDGRNRPGSGAITRAVGAVADRDPDHEFGKPSPETLAAIRERLDCDPAHCLVVGDRLDTDVALGERGGMQTALVLSGSTTRSTFEAGDDGPTPDVVLDHLGDLRTVL